MNFKAAEAARLQMEKLEALFDQICEGEVSASDEAQQRIIDRINELREEVRTNSARTIRNWSDELASLNID